MILIYYTEPSSDEDVKGSWLCLLMKMQTLKTVKIARNIPINGKKQIIEKYNNT